MPLLDPKSAPTDVSEFLIRARSLINADLDKRLACSPDNDPISELKQSMRYAVLGGGKRLRPALTLASCFALGGTLEVALPAACAVELLHAYTLVHDDLPAMDDDDVRRGQPTVHKKYGEATAVLCGDALLTTAFAQLADLGEACATAVSVLAARAGSNELLGGQAIDLAMESQANAATQVQIDALHKGKTGALFSAATELGAISADASPADLKHMAEYGMSMGIAFQHADDVDDGDFIEHRAYADQERQRLARVSIQHIDHLGPQAAFLRSFAEWIGSAC